MYNILYLLLIAFGALLILSFFQFAIYLQQKDKAYLHYSLYLFVMAGFNAVRILDARLTDYYPLSIHTVETMDSVLSNLGFLMYVNFLGVVLNVGRNDKLFFKSWRFIQVFVITILAAYMILKFNRQHESIAEIIMAICSFFSLGFALVWLIRLFRFIKETFYLLIITGTTIAASSIIAGLIVNYFIHKNRISFPGLAIMEIGMMIETVFLSAALGYRLKMAYREKEVYQQSLLEETKRNEELATQTAALLRKELDIRNWQNQISRDLHDDIGASLSSIHVYSSVAAKAMNNDDDKAKDAIQQINQNALRVMENMSDIVWAINTSGNESIALESKLKNYGYDLLNPLGIECTYLIDKEAEKNLTHIEARKNILLIAKEAMNNIAKYSNATTATIQFSVTGSNLKIEIADNGKGFDTANSQKGNGLNNMKQRTESIGGIFSLRSSFENGTVINCTIPLTNISDRAV
jgi:signal transduction histidine kinase